MRNWDVVITCVLGRNLVSRDISGASDPYCKIKYKGNPKQKTAVAKGTVNPHWPDNKMHVVMQSDDRGGHLDIQVWDWDRLSKNDFMGICRIPVDVLLGSESGHGCHNEQWFPLTADESHAGQHFSGEIYVRWNSTAKQ